MSLELDKALVDRDSAAEPKGLRIDVAVATSSRYQKRLYLSLALIIAVLAGLGSLSFWQWLLFLVSALISWIAFRWRCQPLAHLTQPPLNRTEFADWDLLIETYRGAQLWRGELIMAQDYSSAIILQFEINHPQSRLLNCAIYRDQVTPQGWHQLRVLTQVNR